MSVHVGAFNLLATLVVTTSIIFGLFGYLKQIGADKKYFETQLLETILRVGD